MESVATKPQLFPMLDKIWSERREFAKRKAMASKWPIADPGPRILYLDRAGYVDLCQEITAMQDDGLLVAAKVGCCRVMLWDLAVYCLDDGRDHVFEFV